MAVTLLIDGSKVPAISFSNFRERSQWFEKFIQKLLPETPNLHLTIHLDSDVNKYIRIEKKSVEDLLGYSRTQPFRLFNTWFGISSHSYLRLRQFIISMEGLRINSRKLSDIAMVNGLYDRAFYPNLQKVCRYIPR